MAPTTILLTLTGHKAFTRMPQNGRMHAIYVAQNRFFSEEIVFLNQAKEGLYLVKIGWAYDLPDRMLSINNKHPTKKYSYLGRGGWRFVCFRPVFPWRLESSEKASHRRFRSHKLSDESRNRITGNQKTGFELFLGDQGMIDALRSEFIQPTIGCNSLEDHQDYCQAEFMPTLMPQIHEPPKPHWER